MSEMRVVGVRVELPANQPILLLRETNGDRYLPIWIGSVEATAIALEQQGVKPARPLTHDLLKDVITALGRRLEQVRITDLQEGTFYAELVFDGGIKVSARPSDSVALALRIGVPIHAEESVLTEAGLVIPDEQEDEVEKFREFLDSISPEDFRGRPAQLIGRGRQRSAGGGGHPPAAGPGDTRFAQWYRAGQGTRPDRVNGPARRVDRPAGRAYRRLLTAGPVCGPRWKELGGEPAARDARAG
jgi:bifunctional DNase/RNase